MISSGFRVVDVIIVSPAEQLLQLVSAAIVAPKSHILWADFVTYICSSLYGQTELRRGCILADFFLHCK